MGSLPLTGGVEGSVDTRLLSFLTASPPTHPEQVLTWWLQVWIFTPARSPLNTRFLRESPGITKPRQAAGKNRFCLTDKRVGSVTFMIGGTALLLAPGAWTPHTWQH